MNDRYLRVNEVIEMLSVGKSTIWAWVKQGKFPPPIKVNEQTTLWSYAVIENWVAQQQQTQDWVNDSPDLDLF